MSTDNKNIELRHEVLLAFQTALLGMIESSLRGVTIAWSDRSISGHFLFDGEIGAEERECASDVEAEIAASFPNHKIELTAETCNFPGSLNERGLAAWVYRRKE